MSNWKSNLDNFFKKTEGEVRQKETSLLSQFITDVAVSAFEEIGQELESHGRSVSIRHSENTAAIIVRHDGNEEMTYRIQGRMFPNGILPYADIRYRERKGLKLIRMETMFRSGEPDYSLMDVTQQEIIDNFLKHYLPRIEAE